MSKDTVVIEIGSALLRVGIAGEPVPRAVFPVSRFPGLQKCSNHLSVGSSRATQLYTEFFHQLFIENLQIKSRDYRVLIIEKFFCPRLVRDCILTSLLRDLQVIAVSMQPDLIMSLISTSECHGIVIDIGESECRALAIAHGRAVMHSHKMTPLGLRDGAKTFSKSINSLLTNQFGDCSMKDIRCLFDKVISYIESPSDLMITIPAHGQQPERDFLLPSALRSQCLDILVTGTSNSGDDENKDEIGGIAGLILECIRSCNSDVRPLVVQNILCVGGGSMVPGISQAACKEACTRTSTDPRYSSLTPLMGSEGSTSRTPYNTPFLGSSLAWIGGSLFASLKSSDDKFVKLSDLEKIQSKQQQGLNTASQEQSEALSAVPFEVLTAPDWLSLHEEDWTFFGPSARHVRVQT